MATWKMAVIGLESRDRALLETAIDLASGLETGRWELIEEHTDAQVIIVNIDTPEGNNALIAYEAGQMDILVVPYSPTPDEKNNTELQLAPPLSYKNVTSLLKILETKLGSPTKTEPQPTSKTSSATKPKPALISEVTINPVDVAKHKIDWLSDESEETDAPLLTEVAPSDQVTTDKTINENSIRGNTAQSNMANNIEILDSTIELPVTSSVVDHFSADSRLLGLILNVIDSGKTTQIRHKDFPELRIFPDNGWFVFSEELDSHPKMFRESAESFSVEVLEEEIKDELFSGHLPQSLWKLLFTAALFGSEGRLLEHLDPGAPFHLIHTPYFGMIPHTSDHITIAEFMVDNNSDIETISNNTNIDIETVIDFCNACDAIQLLKNGEVMEKGTHSEPPDVTALENDTTVESEIIREPEKPKKSGLINSLWSNLTKPS